MGSRNSRPAEPPYPTGLSDVLSRTTGSTTAAAEEEEIVEEKEVVAEPDQEEGATQGLHRPTLLASVSMMNGRFTSGYASTGAVIRAVWRVLKAMEQGSSQTYGWLQSVKR
ncbi:hypothetical protein AAFF_G00099340 [Aldrovandia affinis]|uniref:Uncharacterized protein n=1 Tax=Aldrovandia affinis TaxID=143900 RepID=A0AAD7RV23_9TELE|nr:hypothetical protein AAFF_G00099340 [Aldrovandia affinis]